MTTHAIEQRHKIEVNTDPQRRCYYGHHYKSEIRLTPWVVMDSGLDAETAERRLKFWRELNDYAINQRGESARIEYRINPEIGKEE